METITIKLRCEHQRLVCCDTYLVTASDLVGIFTAEFDLDASWDGYDRISAIWQNGPSLRIEKVLNSNRSCVIPPEMFTRVGIISVNLVASASESNALTHRYTSFPAPTIDNRVKVNITGSETSPITPSQFEQFVDNVHDEVEVITGMSATATTLPAGSDATASYQDGVLSFGIPRGNTGATGADGKGIASITKTATSGLADTYTITLDDGSTSTFTVTNGADGNGIVSISKTGTSGLVDTYTATFTDGQTATFTVTNGAKGDTGNGITSIEKTSTAGLVDTYTVTYTNGTTSTFTVTNGEKGDKGDKGDPGEVTLSQLEQILPTDTASGSIASFSDGSSLFNAKSVVIGIEPVQSGSGTPSPDNVRPISGWTGAEVKRTGKNLAESVFVEPSTYRWATVLFIECDLQPSTTYTLSYDGISGQAFYSNENVFSYRAVTSVSGRTVAVIRTKATLDKTAPNQYQSGKGWVILKVDAQLSESASFDNVQLELGDTTAHSSYEPYHGTTYPISWQTEAGTVYGGNAEIVSGQLKSEMGMVDLGSLNWQYFETQNVFASWNYSGRFAANGQCVCEVYAQSERNQIDNSICLGQTGWFANAIAIKDMSKNGDTNALKTALQGIMLCYELATPITYNLTPTDITLLQGTNNVWADCGDTEVTYKADIQGYIDKKINALI